VAGTSAHFRVWAPERKRVELVIEGENARIALTPEDNGYFSTTCDAAPGTLYRYRLDGEGPYPDPVSRFQPNGPHGASEVIAPDAFPWSDAAWPGIELAGQVFYELHVGTFTEQGTWRAALGKLPHLHALGITAIEIMPVGEFAGEFGWGYDGVALFAPHRRYGRPDDFRAFVDAAHSLGLGVILDVVYNHLGPSGNYLPCFSPHYFGKRSTEWGDAPNFDRDQARPVRDFIADNAAYWIAEFHLDGFRLDATQSLFDTSEEHIIAELTRRARAAAVGRKIVVVAENEPQAARLARPAADGGYGLDGLWNDDFHHSGVVALTGRREAYYTDYLGRAQEFLAAAKHGFLYQGQYYSWQQQRRGSPTRGLSPHAFICYLENHDQVANTATSDRLWQQSSPAALRALTSLLLLGPWTPLLFQGQEWCTPRPFPYFADHDENELARKVHLGRRKSLSQFPSLASNAVQERLLDPGARATFDAAKLDWSGALLSPQGQRSLALHRDLLALRRSFGARAFDGAVLNDACLLLRWFSEDRRDRLLLVNLAGDLSCTPGPEPLLAPPEGMAWQLDFSSEDPRYGGAGTPDGPLDDAGFRIPARCALLLAAARSQPKESRERSEPREGVGAPTAPPAGRGNGDVSPITNGEEA
jgi:maltooligosyltrehalose trehalohydrolase